MPKPGITVVELGSFVREAAAAMSDEEREQLIGLIADDPTCGVLLKGTGGARKVRFGVGGRGKSGGVRVVYYYHSPRIPVFMLTVFAKNEKDNLTKAESNELAKLVKVLVETYGVEDE